MKTETEKKLENLKKSIKTCSTCGKEFLGLALRTGKEYGNYRIDSIEVNDYPLRCNKCPECSMNCFEKAYNKAKENDDSPIDIECEKDFNTDENPDCYDVFFDDFDESHMWVERDYQDRTDLIDLFEELKRIENEKEKKELCAKEGHIPYKEYSYKGIKHMRTYYCERCREVVTNPNYKKEELEKE